MMVGRPDLDITYGAVFELFWQQDSWFSIEIYYL